MRWEKGWPRTKADRAWILFAWLIALSGCHAIPITGQVDTNAKVAANFQGTVDVHLPSATDPGPMIPVVVRRAPAGSEAARIVIVDVDGLLLNQNLTGIYSVGENPVSAFREKLEMAAGDPRVRGVVLRVHSPGGGVTASDILAEELRRFRQATGKPVVACLMDVATGGAYYLAVGSDRIIALPTSITGGIGALINHANLEDAMAQLNLRVEPVKAGELVDMGSVAAPLSDEARGLFQDMANGFRDRFATRVAQSRPMMTVDDHRSIADGRIVAASRALKLHMVDQLGYVDDAIAEAERLAGVPGSEVVFFERAGHPTRSIYSIVPNVPLQSELIPFSYPGLERSKLPTFLYLWQPDPTITKLSGR
ncbi:S49 family peptidase [Singulisphaera sp. GP187]|uniref:S49 family peptidase n=1 Tax=Singulisphaera sp. GP187 TaxID=1882752 RepID=UPI00094192B7|nr:S49 family peptidase [Singulisphaera sp. GP187]